MTLVTLAGAETVVFEVVVTFTEEFTLKVLLVYGDTVFVVCVVAVVF